MSKILSIDENKTWIRRGYPSLMAGIEVVTAEEIWFARIDDKASCCETWGTIVLNDEDTAYFVGADLICVIWRHYVCKLRDIQGSYAVRVV